MFKVYSLKFIHLLVFIVCIVINCLKTCQSKKMAEREKGRENKIEERGEEGDKAIHTKPRCVFKLGACTCKKTMS